MKSNLRRKLFMSLAATAACAATLTSTTFAWYTSNATVTTDAVNAATESTVDTGSIYIAAAKEYGVGEGQNADPKAAKTFTQYLSSAKPVLINNKTLALGEGTDSNGVKTYTSTVLKPVFYNAGDNTYKPMASVTDSYVKSTDTNVSGTKTYYTKGEGENYTPVASPEGNPSTSNYYEFVPKSKVNYGAEDVDNTMEFVYRLRTANAGTATDVYFKSFSITNTTTTLPTQTALVYNEGTDQTTGITESGAYAVDMLKALKLTFTVTNLEADGTTLANAATSSVVYNFAEFGAAGTHVDVSEGDAVGYYNKATGNNISRPTGYTEGTTLTATATGATALKFTIPASGYVEIRFVFWLDGWSAYNYDTCRQQTFQFHTDFTTTEGDASVWYK